MSLLELSKSINSILVSVEENGVAILTMNKPKSLNALNGDTLHEIVDVMKCIQDDDTIKGVIITAEGKGFIAGADIAEFQGLSVAEGRERSKLGQSACNSIEDLEKPVIAAVNGFALGGGNEVAMAADIRIASTKAVFGQPEVNLGLIPCFGGTQRLSRLIGSGHAKELIFTAKQIKADEAYRIGLVNKVVEPEDLLDAAKEMMATILGKAPLGVSMAKVAINKGADVDLYNGLEIESQVTGLLFSTADEAEGIAAFLEKRPANFVGK